MELDSKRVFQWILRNFSEQLSENLPEAAIQRCSWEDVFWKYVANLEENTHAEVRFQ